VEDTQNVPNFAQTRKIVSKVWAGKSLRPHEGSFLLIYLDNPLTRGVEANQLKVGQEAITCQLLFDKRDLEHQLGASAAVSPMLHFSPFHSGPMAGSWGL
jgi:hypothetical protein